MRSFSLTILSILTRPVLVLTLTASISGCSSHVCQPVAVRQAAHDSVSRDHVVYDSVYIDSQLCSYQRADTVVLHHSKVEYRYRYLRDTLRIVRSDTVPVIQRVEVTRQVRYTPWYMKALAAVGTVALVVVIVRIRRMRNRMYGGVRGR